MFQQLRLPKLGKHWILSLIAKCVLVLFPYEKKEKNTICSIQEASRDFIQIF